MRFEWSQIVNRDEKFGIPLCFLGKKDSKFEWIRVESAVSGILSFPPCNYRTQWSTKLQPPPVLYLSKSLWAPERILKKNSIVNDLLVSTITEIRIHLQWLSHRDFLSKIIKLLPDSGVRAGSDCHAYYDILVKYWKMVSKKRLKPSGTLFYFWVACQKSIYSLWA